MIPQVINQQLIRTGTTRNCMSPETDPDTIRLARKLLVTRHAIRLTNNCLSEMSQDYQEAAFH